MKRKNFIIEEKVDVDSISMQSAPHMTMTRNPLKKLKIESFLGKRDLQIINDLDKEVFADPTLDVTFKMLFGQDKNKDILISLLNSLLNFTGEKEIEDVEINSNELPIAFFNEVKNKSGITSSVDILCINKGKQKIAIEMQGQKTKYFLSREQEYMSKLISGQVKEGEGKKYHEKVLETYILILGKQNMFPKGLISNSKLFEIDVVPTIVQTGEIVPDNKMYWKFYELPKFKKNNIYKNGIDKSDNIKYQWLEFLIDCGSLLKTPDRHDLIKKCYDLMIIAKWDHDTKVLYWKQKQSLTTLEEQHEMGFEEGVLKGKIEGKLKGEIKGEIKETRKFLKLQKEFAEDKEKLKFLEFIKPTYKYLTKDQQIELSGNLNLSNSDDDSDIAEQWV